MPTGVYNHEIRVIHGHNRKGKTTPEYRAFNHAKERCNNPKDKGYSYYGERGIKFLFNDFQEFLNEIGLRPSKKYSLDRILNDGNYEVGNVKWSTRSEQMKNRRSNGLKGLKRGPYGKQ